MDTRVNAVRKTRDTYSDLKDLITNYRFRLGQHLNLTKLSERLGVSVTPVREALIRLNAESLVTFLPGRGFFPKFPNAIEQLMLHDLAFSILSVCLETVDEVDDVRGSFLTQLQISGGRLDDAEAYKYPAVVANYLEDIYVEIASRSGNTEFARVMRNFGDRTHFIRSIELEQYGSCRTRGRLCLELLHQNDPQRAIDVIQERFASTRSRIDGLVKEALVRVSR